MLVNGKYRLFEDFSRIWNILPSALRKATVWAFTCIAAQAIIEILSILSISFLALSIAAPEQILQKPFAQLAIRHFPVLHILEEDLRYLALLSAIAVTMLIICKNALFAYVSYLCARLGERLANYVGRLLFRQYLYKPYIEHLSGDSTLSFQVISWRTALATMTTKLMDAYTYFSITAALGLLVVIFTPKDILIVIIFLGLTAYFIYKTLRRRMAKTGQNVAEWDIKENKIILNAMRGIREILIYQQQPVFLNRFANTCKAGIGDRTLTVILPPVPTWVLESAGFFIICVTIVIMIWFNDSSMTRITAVVTIIMLTAWRVLPLLNRALQAMLVMQGTRHPAFQCLEYIEKAIHNTSTSVEKPDPTFKFQDSIELRNVNFAYTSPNTETAKESSLSLQGISLRIHKGERIGIIGRSGAGKSTLTLLLCGLATPSKGQILVDGEPLAGGRLAAYRRMVGFVPQNPYIMAGSIAENVAFSQWGLPWDAEKVREVCLMAEFDVAIERGIDHMLGQDGAGLSGGQAQRLSIARALYPNPAILIFDEATSALDTGVEKAIMDTIFSLPRAITTITIAHRLGTVRRCETIVWIEAGRIVECGPPDMVLPHYEKFLEETAKHKMSE